MTYDRHNYPHKKREIEGRGIVRSYDLTCAECARVGFCTWCQGPCEIDLVPQAPIQEPKRDPFDTLREDPFVGTEVLYENEFSQDADNPLPDIVFSHTAPCPQCGEVHPV